MPADKPNRQRNQQKPYDPKPRPIRRGLFGSLSDLLRFPGPTAAPSAAPSQMEPPYGQNPGYLEEQPAPMGTDFGGQIANAEAGPSHCMPPAPTPVNPTGQTANAEAGPSHWMPSAPTPVNSTGQMANAMAGPSVDWNSCSNFAFADTMQPLNNGETFPYTEDSGNAHAYAQHHQLTSIKMEPVEAPSVSLAMPPLSNGEISYHQNSSEASLPESAGVPFNAAAGPAAFLENGTYYRFEDGPGNQGVAPITRGRNRATKTHPYESTIDFSDVNNGQISSIKAEVIEETNDVLNELVIVPNENAISLSTVSATDCLLMGLDTDTPTSVSSTAANEKIVSCFATFLGTINIHAPTLRDDLQDTSTISVLAATISMISRHVNDSSEEFSRKIIDQFTLALHGAAEGLGLSSSEVPELRLATQESPAEISRNGFRTILTGFTDYGLFFRAEWDQLKLKKFCDSHKLDNFLSRMTAGRVQIFLIEAKSKEYAGSRLVNCLPQMGAECIATMAASRQTEIAWCLSTGSTWIFGTMKWDADNCKYVMYRLDPMEIELGEANINSNPEVVRRILTACLCWTIVPAKNITTTVFRN